MTRPSKFPPEFKARAIDLYRSSEGRTIADVAWELGIGTETFRKWVRQDEADRGERDDRVDQQGNRRIETAPPGECGAEAHQRDLEVGERVFAQEADPTRRRS